jgi:hypothetical protein
MDDIWSVEIPKYLNKRDITILRSVSRYFRQTIKEPSETDIELYLIHRTLDDMNKVQNFTQFSIFNGEFVNDLAKRLIGLKLSDEIIFEFVKKIPNEYYDIKFFDITGIETSEIKKKMLIYMIDSYPDDPRICGDNEFFSRKLNEVLDMNIRNMFIDFINGKDFPEEYRGVKYDRSKVLYRLTVNY